MLADQGLLTGEAQKTTLRRLLAVTWLAVGGLGLLKLVVGLARGRTNVGFLILLLIGFTFLIFRLLKLPRRLPAGDRYLSWLQEAYSGLRRPIEIGQQDSARDLALAAGNHGYDALEYLESLPLERVVEVHLAGGLWSEGQYVDTHTRSVPEESWRLLEWLVPRTDIRAVIIERDDDLPPFGDLLAEVRRAEGRLRVAR